VVLASLIWASIEALTGDISLILMLLMMAVVGAALGTVVRTIGTRKELVRP